MAMTFRAIPEPSADVVGHVSDLTPENPFYTNEYACVRQRLGSRPCAIVLQDGMEIVAGCLGFLTEGRINSRLEITSLPVIPDKDLFWQGLFEHCKASGISVLSVHTFASNEAVIGEVKDRISHKRRSEYQLDLGVPDLLEKLNRRHHRLIKKARSADLALLRPSDRAARERHVQLANLSLDRRRGRGESIDEGITIGDVNAFLECGSGEIFQSVSNGEVFSSLLVARSRTGAYAQSSGTSDEGRAIGSSHFLFHETACLLKSEGATAFNLGGADEHSTGLQEFKLGMGSVRIELESAEFYTGSKWKKFATRAAALLTSAHNPTPLFV
jgi:hypothetical protein